MGARTGSRWPAATGALVARRGRAFARAMRKHHEQAVTMSVLVRDATADPQVRGLALDIELTQQQMGQMFGWLSMWGYSQGSSEPPMAWMESDMGDMGGMAGTGAPAMASDRTGMPGMASRSDLRPLPDCAERAERLAAIGASTGREHRDLADLGAEGAALAADRPRRSPPERLTG